MALHHSRGSRQLRRIIPKRLSETTTNRDIPRGAFGRPRCTFDTEEEDEDGARVGGRPPARRKASYFAAFIDGCTLFVTPRLRNTLIEPGRLATIMRWKSSRRCSKFSYIRMTSGLPSPFTSATLMS